MARKAKIRNLKTGEVVERWPVDALEMVSRGNWEDIGGTLRPQRPLPHVAAAEASVQNDPHAIMSRAREEGSQGDDQAIPEEEEEVPGGALPAPEDAGNGELESQVTETYSDIDAAAQAMEWPLKVSPENYLARSPDGPNAELAQRILDSVSGD